MTVGSWLASPWQAFPGAGLGKMGAKAQGPGAPGGQRGLRLCCEGGRTLNGPWVLPPFPKGQGLSRGREGAANQQVHILGKAKRIGPQKEGRSTWQEFKRTERFCGAGEREGGVRNIRRSQPWRARGRLCQKTQSPLNVSDLNFFLSCELSF